MKKAKLISTLSITVGVLMIAIGLFLSSDGKNIKLNRISVQGFDVKNLAASTNMIVKEVTRKEEEEDLLLMEVEMETAPASVIIPPRVEVYEGMTLEELGMKLDRNLGNDIVAGKGLFIATECINRGVDPYIATAILLLETGCKSRCSNLARYCNNFGGQKGTPSCNGGSYKQYATMDEGLVGFISNLSRNYFALGLTTPETIGPKYAENKDWPSMVNQFVGRIRAN
ncbi:MAG: glucosaminidase domain-containing protein [Bacilli bacterium]|nr:glucosaminidase domain-containing protein [Bacilli bacterium]